QALRATAPATPPPRHQLPPDRMNRHPIEGLVAGRQQSDHFDLRILPQHVQGPRRVLAGRPGEQSAGAAAVGARHAIEISWSAMPTLLELTAALRVFVAERDWAQFHDPKNLAMLVASE